MKKIIVILLPTIVLVAMIFALREKEFNARAFLELIQSWRFENILQPFENVKNTFESVGLGLQALDNSANIVELVQGLFTAYINSFKGFGQIIVGIAGMLVAIVKNASTIIYWLF